MSGNDKYSVQYVGLDCEMTGNGGPTTHQLIQLGLSSGRSSFVSDVGHDRKSYAYQEEALAVCGFTPARIEAGPPAETVDLDAVEWLEQQYPSSSPWPTGFGVSYFDLPYIAAYLPRTLARLNKRCADLTSVYVSSWRTHLQSPVKPNTTSNIGC